jgi:hypothetical protein
MQNTRTTHAHRDDWGLEKERVTKTWALPGSYSIWKKREEEGEEYQEYVQKIACSTYRYNLDYRCK